MKYILSSLVILLSTFTGSAKAESSQQPSAFDPTSLCDGNACSEPMNNIAQGYRDGVANFADQDLTGYSGKCFHMNSLYNPNQAHHGGFVFAKSESDLKVSGLFSFFYNEDPYSGMSAQDMATAFKNSGSTPSPAQQLPDHVELAHVSDDTDIRYWYRNDASKKDLFVIGRTADKSGNISSAVFCKMLRHN